MSALHSAWFGEWSSVFTVASRSAHRSPFPDGSCACTRWTTQLSSVFFTLSIRRVDGRALIVAIFFFLPGMTLISTRPPGLRNRIAELESLVRELQGSVFLLCSFCTFHLTNEHMHPFFPHLSAPYSVLRSLRKCNALHIKTNPHFR